MTIADEIQALSADRTAIQNAISSKGGTVTLEDGFDDFAAAIGTIPSGGTLQDKTGITPTTSSQTIVPDSGYDGLSSVQINAISPTKAAQTYTPGTVDQTIASGRWLTGAQTIKGDANLVAGNIKKDVSIFGVTGTYEGSGGGGLSGDFYILDISFTNPSGTSEFGNIDIQMLLSDTHESQFGQDYYTDRMPLVQLHNPSETITIYLPVEAYGIVIEPWSNSPDGAEYYDSGLTLTGSLSSLGMYNGYQIRVQGSSGTITVDGIEYDP